MISSIAAMAIIGVLPLNEIPSSPSRISGVDSMMMKKMANRGASLPARATMGLPAALEIGRNVDRGNGIAAADRPRRGREVARTFDDAETGRYGHLFHEGARGVRPVRIDDDHPEPADDRMTEHRGQDREGK